MLFANGYQYWVPMGPDSQIKFGSEGMMIPFGTAPFAIKGFTILVNEDG